MNCKSLTVTYDAGMYWLHDPHQVSPYSLVCASSSELSFKTMLWEEINRLGGHPYQFNPEVLNPILEGIKTVSPYNKVWLNINLDPEFVAKTAELVESKLRGATRFCATLDEAGFYPQDCIERGTGQGPFQTAFDEIFKDVPKTTMMKVSKVIR